VSVSDGGRRAREAGAGRKAQKTSREGKQGACPPAAASELLSPLRTEGGRPDLDEWWVASTCLGESLLVWMKPTTQWHWLLPALLFSVRPPSPPPPLPLLTLGGRRGRYSCQPWRVTVCWTRGGVIPCATCKAKKKEGNGKGEKTPFCRGAAPPFGATALGRGEGRQRHARPALVPARRSRLYDEA